jgi:hypothetical protein
VGIWDLDARIGDHGYRERRSAVANGQTDAMTHDDAEGDLVPSDPTPLICGSCLRTVAPSEILSFAAGAAKRAGVDVMCPACADAPSRRRIFGRAPNFYIVPVPDEVAYDRCIQSYAAHQWTLTFRDETVARLRFEAREVVVEIGLEDLTVGQQALRALDPRFWPAMRKRNAPKDEEDADEDAEDTGSDEEGRGEGEEEEEGSS